MCTIIIKLLFFVCTLSVLKSRCVFVYCVNVHVPVFVILNRPDNFSPETLAQHVQELTELVTRDKNRPSVVMWSLANEPDSTLPEAESYFK